jgi:hypothetical protein
MQDHDSNVSDIPYKCNLEGEHSVAAVVLQTTQHRPCYATYNEGPHCSDKWSATTIDGVWLYAYQNRLRDRIETRNTRLAWLEIRTCLLLLAIK